jgi:predicted SnoaL-like aldol condensation-catalyzing enzyme
MNTSVFRVVIVAALATLVAALTHAQAPVVENPDHEAMLRSPNPQLAKNKRLVYDFWREVVEGGHVELAEKYVTEGYIQHNPNFASGREVLVDMFAKSRKPQPIQPRVKTPIVALIAEGDLVMIGFVREHPDPKDAAKKYTTTGITFFRVENGKLAEHWDTALKN